MSDKPDNPAPPTVYVVDDDAAVRTALCLVMESAGLHAECYASARAFLDHYDGARSGCLVLDMCMPDMNGLELQDLLHARGDHVPIIFLTGHGAVSLAVEAMKAGALDFLEKPVDNARLLRLVEHALLLNGNARRERAQHAVTRTRLGTLTPREREVLDRLMQGKLNKTVAAELGISTRTVELHRTHILHKLGVRKLSAAARLTAQVETEAAALAETEDHA